MGFFGLEEAGKAVVSKTKGIAVDTLHRGGCKLCPLDKGTGCKHPKMIPTGGARPLIYMLGAAPTKDDDLRGKHFQGPAGRFLRKRLKKSFSDVEFRWNHVIRTMPGDRLPNDVEIECCRPSIVRDIEDSKPIAIFGFGNVPLNWVLGPGVGGVRDWTGRRTPVKIGEHTCWFFPMLDPIKVQDEARFVPRDEMDYGSDNEFAFALHMKEALRAVEDGLPDPIVHTPEMAREGVELVTGAGGRSDLNYVLDYLEEAAKGGTYGFDYETNRLRPYRKGAKILSFALSGKIGTIAVAMDHREAKWSYALREELDEAFRKFLHEPKPIKISHKLDFEMEWSAFFYGKTVLRAGQWGDSLAQAWVLDERKGMHSLEMLGVQHFGINLKSIAGVDRDHLDDEPIEKVLLYNGVDGRYHKALWFKQGPLLEEADLVEVYEHTARRIPALVLTSMQGVPLDQKVRGGFTEAYEEEIAAAAKVIQDMDVVRQFEKVVGRKFNPASSHDITALFKKVLRVKDSDDKTDKGGVKTDAKVLEGLKHPIGKAIVAWRKPMKNLSTYVLPMTPGSPDLYDDGLLHPIISTCTTDTWRTSSDSPNVQNYPKRNKAVVLRKMVKGRKANERIVAFDYAGIQGRNVAMESHDPTLIKYFFEHYEIHDDWMHRIAKADPKWVPKGKSIDEKKDKGTYKFHRHLAKNKFVFPAFFGAQKKTLAKGLSDAGGKFNENVAEDLRLEFFEEFPEINKWHKKLMAFYYKHGYVTGYSGHKRHAPVNMNQLINAPIQADESIIVLSSMIALSELDYKVFQPTFEIHDDLTFVWPKEEINKRSETVITEMLKVRFDWINCPLEVEMSVGEDWCDPEKTGRFESVGRNGWKELPL